MGGGSEMSTVTTVGTKLPEWELPLTPTLIVSTAIATRDFQDVHHDRDLAQGHGSKDIFMNILTTTGLVQKYVGDWARDAVGPDFRITACGLRLGAPAYPYDTMTFSAEVTDVTDGVLTIDVLGLVSLGNHVNARVTLTGGDQ
jgi:acyl dehydratase